MPSFSILLVGTDLEAGSRELLRAAGALAMTAGARLHVLHSFDLPSERYRGETAPISFPGRVEEAERRLSAVVAEAIPAGVPVTKEVIIYSAHKALTRVADEIGADLIVLGPHRDRPIGDSFLGSTADRVVRTSRVPCLILRPSLTLPLRRILVPTDLSPASEAAVEAALEIATSYGSSEGASAGVEVTVVHVVDRSLEVDEEFRTSVIVPELHRTVERVRSGLVGAEKLTVREEVRSGESAIRELQIQMSEISYDLIVVGTQGHGAVSRALLGSVASGLVRVAPCSVLLVPPRRDIVSE